MGRPYAGFCPNASAEAENIINGHLSRDYVAAAL